MTPRTFAATAGLVLAATLAAPTAAASNVGGPGPTMGWLGAALEPAPERLEAEGSSPSAGVIVSSIVEGSPADKAGLRGRDVIVGIDGMDVVTPADMIERIKKLPPDSWVGLRLLRRGVERQVEVRLGTRPEKPAQLRMVYGWLGVRAMEIPPKLRTHFGAPEEAGVMVTELTPGGPAEAAGLELGDVVYALDGEPVPSVGALKQLITRSGVGNEMEISIGRSGAPIVLEAVVARTPGSDGK